MNSAAVLNKSPQDFPAGHSPSKPNCTRLLDAIIPLGILLFSLAYFAIPLRYCSFEPDEGILLQGAERVLHGQLPYRDFFTFYTPGSFYLLALVFRVLGDSFAIARSSLAVAGAMCSVVTYLLARRSCGLGISLMMAVLATVSGTGFRFLVLHNWYSTLFCCLALYAAVRFVESSKWYWAAASSFSASLVFLLEQSKGAGLCIGLVAGFWILLAAGAIRLDKSAGIGAGLGFSLPLIATLACFEIHQTAKVMVLSWLWPLNHYTRANHVPYGFQNWSDATRSAIFQNGPLWARAIKVFAVSPNFVTPALPLAAVGLLIFFAAKIFRGRTGVERLSCYVLVCSVVCGFLISVIISRADILHFIYLAPIDYVVLAWILGASDFKSRILRVARPYLTGYVALSFALLGFAVLLTANHAKVRMQTRRGVIVTSQQDPIIPYVDDQVASGGKLLVYPYLPIYNYLTATISPSRYDYFQPGMNTSDQAEELLRSLQSPHPPPVLFEPWFVDKIPNSWPDTPLGAIAINPVADFITRNYRNCQVLTSAGGWHLHYLLPKATPCT